MITRLILSVIQIMQFLLVIRAVISWFPDVSRSSFGQMIDRLTEPVLAPFRNYLRRFSVFNGFPIDMSFLVLYLGLEILRTVVIVLL